jgi:tripartite-type tricarboxylate transporter receptor subunit TctC
MLPVALFCVLSAAPAFAQSFPSRIVRVIQPNAPGGTVDLLARPLARELSSIWGQQVLIENIPGGDMTIGTSRAAAAAPDGYTLLMTVHQPVLGNRFLFKRLAYDPDKSLMPLTMVARSGNLLLVHPSLPVKSVRELVTLARSMPGKISYASTGRGSGPPLILETLAKRENLSLNHVPYKGQSPALTALVSGEAAISALTPAGSGGMVKAGKVRAIAITSANRTKLFPDVPTTAESGFPYLSYTFWIGLFAPAGTSAPIVERIHRDTTAILKKPEFVEKYIAPAGFELVANSPAEFTDAIRADVASVGAMVKAANIQPE